MHFLPIFCLNLVVSSYHTASTNRSLQQIIVPTPAFTLALSTSDSGQSLPGCSAARPRCLLTQLPSAIRSSPVWASIPKKCSPSFKEKWVLFRRTNRILLLTTPFFLSSSSRYDHVNNPKAFTDISWFSIRPQVCPYYEKLDEILATSERQLLTLLGPDVPTTSTTTTSTVTPKLAHEEVLLENIEETVRLEEKVFCEGTVSFVYYY